MNILSSLKKVYFSRKVLILMSALIFAAGLVFLAINFSFQALACCEPFPCNPPSCLYSISGIKFNDENGNGVKNCGESNLGGWTITIKGPGCFSYSTITNERGFYQFSGLFPGSYTLCEVQQDGWEQTYPTENNGCHLIEIDDDCIGGVNFGNRQAQEPQPYCGDGFVNGEEECDDGENNGLECTPEYGSTCNYCSSECEIVELTGPYCGDGNVDESYEECEEDADCYCGMVCVDCACTRPPPQPYCGNGILETGEECEVGHECYCPEGYICNLQTCLCEEEVSEPVCGNGVVEGDEECDDGNNADGDGCSANCVLEGGPSGPECTDADNDSYYVYDEVYCQEGNDCDDTNPEVNPGATEICNNEIDDDCGGNIDCDDSDCAEDPACVGEPEPECQSEATQSCNTGQPGICAVGTQTCDEEGFWGQCLPNNGAVAEICNNGLDDDCDGYIDSEDSNCQAPSIGGGGGGGAVLIGLIVFNETNKETLTDAVTVTWFTNIPATSRVVYDTVSHPTPGVSPDYNYANSTTEDSSKVTFHTVTIAGLTPCTTYSWRAVSHGSPDEILGDEIACTTKCLGGETTEEGGEEGGVSLEGIEDELQEIIEGIEKIREELEGMIPPQSPAEVPLVGTEEEVEEEEIGVEEVGEEIGEEEEFEEEQLGEEGFEEEEFKTVLERFLAAIGGLFNLEDLCWIVILLAILIILFFLSKRRKKKEGQI